MTSSAKGDAAVIAEAAHIYRYTNKPRADNLSKRLDEINNSLVKLYQKRLKDAQEYRDPFMMMGGRRDEEEAEKPKYPPGVEEQIASLRTEYAAAHAEWKSLIDWTQTRLARLEAEYRMCSAYVSTM
jgi:malate synthase